jgi:hypothetical protein
MTMNDARDDQKVGGLDVLTTGLNLAELDLHGGDGLWDEVRRYTSESQLEALVDQCMDGRSAPRLWAIMESPGAGPSAVAAALGVGTLLADRGQAVVLLDADEQDPRITRWLGRTEQEGWIDMVRFGASLHASSDPLPSDNRRGSVVGVGSFTPTGVTPEEVVDLLGRLRHQADDLVLVVPAKLRSQPWLGEADIRLLCWDLLSRSSNDTQTIIGELDRMNARPDAVLGFGVEEYAAIQDRLQESLPSSDVDLDAGQAPRAAADHAERTEPEQEMLAAESPVAPPADQDLSIPELDAERDERGERRTSRLFVWLAAVVTVCVVAAAIFLVGQWRGDGDEPMRVADSGARTDRTASATMPPAGTGSPENGTGSMAADTPAETSTPAEGGEEPVSDMPADPPASSDQVETSTLDPDIMPATPDDQRREPEGGGVVEPPVDAGVTPEQAVDRAGPAEQPGASAEETLEEATESFDLTPFRDDVGEAGWSIWLFSLPSEEDARREVRDLERRGFVAEYRAVELEERGRWFRVYTGSFATRAEANAAATALKSHLDQDWAVPARF